MSTSPCTRTAQAVILDDDSGRTRLRVGPPTADDPVVGRMAANPEPEQPVIDFDGQRTMSPSNSRRPESVQLLEVQRWMSGVSLQQVEACIGVLANGRPQLTVRGPERRARMVVQSRRDLPAAWSARAASAIASRRPSLASRLIRSSHISESNRSYQDLNSLSWSRLNDETASLISRSEAIGRLPSAVTTIVGGRTVADNRPAGGVTRARRSGWPRAAPRRRGR